MIPPLVGFALVVGTFTIACTSLVATIVGLARLGRKRDAALSLVVPLGVVLAYRAGLKVRAFLLAGSVLGYLLTRAVLG